MDTNGLEHTEYVRQQLGPFIEECERRGYPVKDVRVHESIPGAHNSFMIDVEAHWADSMGEALHTLWPILKETVPVEVSQYIRGIVADYSPESRAQTRREALASLGIV